MKKLRVILALSIILSLVGCGGIPKGALPDLAEPQVLPPPKMPGITLIVVEGKRFYKVPAAEMEAEAIYRERMAGEVEKGVVGMRAYRGLLEKCLQR